MYIISLNYTSIFPLLQIEQCCLALKNPTKPHPTESHYFSTGFPPTSVLQPLSATASDLSVVEDGGETSALLGPSPAISAVEVASRLPFGRLSVNSVILTAVSICGSGWTDSDSLHSIHSGGLSLSFGVDSSVDFLIAVSSGPGFDSRDSEVAESTKSLSFSLEVTSSPLSTSLLSIVASVSGD
ncbi:hypothetical protein Hanom_Chr04g00359131 [Helianthus anomalus]